MRARCALLAFLVACGGTYGGNPPNRPTAKPSAGATTKRGIEAAALPYSILDARTGRQVDTQEFWATIGRNRIVCVGEDHPNPHHHWVQLEVMSQLAARERGRKLALGMEMFQRPFQGILDDYAAKRIDEPTMLSRSAWEDRWGFDYGFYGPTIRKAIESGAALVALNASREIVQKVARKGVTGLSPDEKQQLPELVLDDARHRAWFDSMMENMGGAHAHGQAETTVDDEDKDAAPKGGHKSAGADASNPHGSADAMPSADNIYAAQVVWDETMADTAASWAKATPNGLMVVLAGNGHCHDTAVVGRIKRRGVPEVVSVRPILDTDGNVAEALANPMNDFLVVLQLPR